MVQSANNLNLVEYASLPYAFIQLDIFGRKSYFGLCFGYNWMSLEIKKIINPCCLISKGSFKVVFSLKIYF